MKKNKRIDTLKEILKELSTIPVLFGLLAIIGLVGYLLPDSILKNLPFEVLCVLGVVVILGILYAIAGIVAIIQKNRAKKDKSTKDEKQRSN